MRTAILCGAIVAAALQASAPAFQALHAVEHAAHDARFAAEIGDLSHQTLRAGVPLHAHEPGESCESKCASCKVQARLATLIHAAPALVEGGRECSNVPSLIAAAAPRAALLSVAAPRAPPALLS